LILLLGVVFGGYLLRDRLLGGADEARVNLAASPAASPASIAQQPEGGNIDAGPQTRTDDAASTSGEAVSVLTPPTATAPSTRRAAVSATANQPAAAGVEPTAAPATDTGAGAGAEPGARTLEELLPTDSALPEGLTTDEDNERDRAAVLAALGDSEEADAFLTESGWSGNRYRNFETAPGTTTESGTTNLSVSGHQFADAAAANDALYYFSDYVVTTDAYEEVEGEAVGDDSRWIRLDTAEGNTTVVFVQSGSAMIRIGGFSPSGDPAPDVATVAGSIFPPQ